MAPTVKDRYVVRESGAPGVGVYIYDTVERRPLDMPYNGWAAFMEAHADARFLNAEAAAK